MHKSLQTILSQKFAHLGALRQVETIAGGSINQAYRLQFEKESLFVKHQPQGTLDQFFAKEVAGLKLLQQSPFAVPTVFAFADEAPCYLVLSFEEAGTPLPNFNQQFGKNLAAMHRQSQAQFGLNSWNYMGALKQSNEPTSNWPEFFAQQRILPLVRLARDKGFFSANFLSRIDQLLEKVEKWVPQEPPALVHGDLWSGNYHVSPKGAPMLIDPAAYYGHREVDLAMMHLFGGFDPAIFKAYQNYYPLGSDWKSRIDLHNLYPVLVHVILFGGGYAAQAQSIVKKYV
jgi:fructosamine-3-kinase